MRRSSLLMSVVALAGLAASTPAWAVQAGITLEVHQDILNQQFWPNDFHIEGLICSHNGVAPVVLQHLDDLFAPNFTYNITYTGQDCWYWFEATWWLQPGQYIPYCNVLNLGVLFDVDASNVIVDLIGWWTRDGVPVGKVYGQLRNQGFVPLVGFNVQDTGSPQVLTLSNGQLPGLPPLPVPPIAPPWPPAPIQQVALKVDVIPFPPGAAPDFTQLTPTGGQLSWPWIPVVHPDGTPIGPTNPLPMAPDSFFDVFLEGFGKSGFRPAMPFTVEPGGFLVTRQAIRFTNNNNEVETRWFWEIHGAEPFEACCFPDGHCEDITRFNCLQRGGTPQGAGSVCSAATCQPKPGACCYGDYQCFVTLQSICETQFLGAWKGPGTTCNDGNSNGYADICEPTEPLGACCYGTAAPLCIVTTQALCEQQFLGTWKGPGTTCVDADGDQIADICEPPVEEGACCLPNGVCVMLPAPDCRQQGGTPLGANVHCLGDRNGNGRDDICEAKYIQPPDLSPNGVDVNATFPLILADDFLCTERGRISEIAVFASWRYDVLPGDPRNVKFRLSIHEDIPDPDGDGPLYSKPGQLVWFREFAPNTYLADPYVTGIQEGFWTPPAPNTYIFPGDTVCWLYSFHIPPREAFCQLGTPQKPKVYWLDVQAELPTSTNAQFGWKTSTKHWNDNAVWGQGIDPIPGPWNELYYPAGHQLAGQAIDLAFTVGGLVPCRPRCLGDANCDGVIDWRDIDFLVAGMNDNLPAWEGMFPAPGPTCPFGNLDTNDDAHVDWRDIDPFVALMNTVCVE